MDIKDFFSEPSKQIKGLFNNVKYADYTKPFKKQTWIDIFLWLKNKILTCKTFVINNKFLVCFLAILVTWNIFLQIKVNDSADIINDLPSSYDLYDIESELKSDIDEINDELDEINNQLYDLQDRVEDLESDSHAHLYY